MSIIKSELSSSSSSPSRSFDDFSPYRPFSSPPLLSFQSSSSSPSSSSLQDEPSTLSPKPQLPNLEAIRKSLSLKINSKNGIKKGKRRAESSSSSQKGNKKVRKSAKQNTKSNTKSSTKSNTKSNTKQNSKPNANKAPIQKPPNPNPTQNTIQITNENTKSTSNQNATLLNVYDNYTSAELEDEQNRLLQTLLQEDATIALPRVNPKPKSQPQEKESPISSAELHKAVIKMAPLTQNERDQLKRNDIYHNACGSFNKIEFAYLKRNMARYLKDHTIPEPTLLFGITPNDSEQTIPATVIPSLKLYYRLFAIQTNFILRLAKDITYRTQFQVYTKARTLFGGLKQTRDLTQEDRDFIAAMYRQQGGGAATMEVLEEQGYSPVAIRSVFSKGKGPSVVAQSLQAWSIEEIRDLEMRIRRKLAQNHNGARLEGPNYGLIPWNEIAVEMDIGRTGQQCEEVFYKRLVHLILHREREERIILGLRAQGMEIYEWNGDLELAKMVALIRMCRAQMEQEVNWNWVQAQFDPRCYQIILKSYNLESVLNRAPNPNATFAQSMDHLYCHLINKIQSTDKLTVIEQFVNTCCRLSSL